MFAARPSGCMRAARFQWSLAVQLYTRSSCAYDHIVVVCAAGAGLAKRRLVQAAIWHARCPEAKCAQLRRLAQGARPVRFAWKWRRQHHHCPWTRPTVRPLAHPHGHLADICSPQGMPTCCTHAHTDSCNKPPAQPCVINFARPVCLCCPLGACISARTHIQAFLWCPQGHASLVHRPSDAFRAPPDHARGAEGGVRAAREARRPKVCALAAEPHAGAEGRGRPQRRAARELRGAGACAVSLLAASVACMLFAAAAGQMRAM
jgi:hypothetical protein